MITHGTTGPGNRSNLPDLEAAQAVRNGVKVPPMALSARVTGTGTTQTVGLLAGTAGDREDPAARCPFARSRSFVPSSDTLAGSGVAGGRCMWGHVRAAGRCASGPAARTQSQNPVGQKGVRMRIHRREQGNAIVTEADVWTPVESLRADAQPAGMTINWSAYNVYYVKWQIYRYSGISGCRPLSECILKTCGNSANRT